MSKPIVEAYLFFGGRCEEALNFYTQAIDARVQFLMRFSEAPDPPPPDVLEPGFENKVMHALFAVGDSKVMASDGCNGQSRFEGFALSIATESEPDADRYFNALADGGKVTMPLGKTFWSPRFGMLTDRFGVGWMVNALPEK